MVEVSLRSFHFHLLQGFCDADKIQAKEGHQDQDQGSSSKLRLEDYSSEIQTNVFNICALKHVNCMKIEEFIAVEKVNYLVNRLCFFRISS